MLTSFPKEKINILLLENISATAGQFFAAQGYSGVQEEAGALAGEQLMARLADVHILGIRSKTQITKAVLDAAPRLQAIGCFCIGVNQVDLKAATDRGVAVFNAPYSNTRSVAELVIGLSIMLLRRVSDKNKAAHEGRWFKESQGSYELRGKTLGIVGYGNIGTQLGIMAEALGMRVLYYDMARRLPLGNAQACATLTELMGLSDVLSLHVPETAGTTHMIHKDNLIHMKPSAVLVNCSRGRVVDIDELSLALQSGALSGAAIDVFPEEPEKNGQAFACALQGLPNVILTPHIGGSTEEAQLNIAEDVVQKLFSFLEQGVTTGSHTVPDLSLPAIGHAHRILHIHKNMPGVMSAVNGRLGERGINILGQYLKTNERIGYVVLDVDMNLSLQALDLLKSVEGTIKTRILY